MLPCGMSKESALHFLQIPVQFCFCFRHSLEQLLDNLRIVVLESLVDGLEFFLGHLVYFRLRSRLRSLVLGGDVRISLHILTLHTSFWNDWNSFSLFALISSISLAASVRASFSFCVRSVDTQRLRYIRLGVRYRLTGTCFLYNLGRLLLGF